MNFRNLATTYTYNGLGDLISLVSPDTGTTVYTYDEAGNPKTVTDARGVTATYAYHAGNRLRLSRAAMGAPFLTLDSQP